MNILGLLGRNGVHGPQTLRYPDRNPPAPDYRGPVVLDPATCRSCSRCAQVCVTEAITFVRVDADTNRDGSDGTGGGGPGAPEDDRYRWTYDPARCTYCGLCVSACPVNCLWQAGDRGPNVASPGAGVENVTVLRRRRRKKAARKGEAG
jgi:formate hydrogenlyase subunit 6/NADH:ubiquinone oxidoreductase subunit I